MKTKSYADWRCVSAGLPDIDAQRFGMQTRVYYGIWRDWEYSDNSDDRPIPTCRLVIDEADGCIVGGTLYGPHSHRYAEELREMIGSAMQANEIELE